MNHLGHQHDSEPVTKSDKAMSQRHLKHRVEISKEKLKIAAKSIEYNKAHRDEHHKAMKEMAKEIKQEKKNLAKASKKLHG